MLHIFLQSTNNPNQAKIALFRLPLQFLLPEDSSTRFGLIQDYNVCITAFKSVYLTCYLHVI